MDVLCTFDDERKRVITEPVRLNQIIRSSDTLLPWKDTDDVLPGDETAS